MSIYSYPLFQIVPDSSFDFKIKVLRYSNNEHTLGAWKYYYIADQRLTQEEFTNNAPLFTNDKNLANIFSDFDDAKDFIEKYLSPNAL
jgi:hypothetical protein